MDALAAGFVAAFAPLSIAYVFLGLLIGYIVGVLPGLSRPTALALAVPLTYYMTPVAAIGFLIGISKGSATGGSVSAILLNTPGEPSSAATCLDGYPLARQGRARSAMRVALYGSVFGDVFATVILIALAGPLSLIALKMGPVEMTAVLLFALTFIAGFSGGSILKGLIAGFLGMFFATTGLDAETGTPRLVFGQVDLLDGMPLMVLAIGTLALSEMFIQMGTPTAPVTVDAGAAKTRDRLTGAELRGLVPVALQSSVVGTLLGMIPGLGASVASFVAYALAKNRSKTPEKFGHGSLEGVAAAETADNAVVPAGLIPLFALGLPGGIAAALIIGAFTVHGLTPGPLMFATHPQVIYGIYAAMLIASALMLLIGFFGASAFAGLALIPERIIVPVIVFLCLVGAYLEGSTLFGTYLVIAFAVLGWFMRKLDFSFVAFLIGFVIGPMFELSLRQALIITDGKPEALLQRPIALGILILAALSTWRLSVSNRRLRSAQDEN
jgi:putative tricarboxylic transport membrane protein